MKLYRVCSEEEMIELLNRVPASGSWKFFTNKEACQHTIETMMICNKNLVGPDGNVGGYYICGFKAPRTSCKEIIQKEFYPPNSRGYKDFLLRKVVEIPRDNISVNCLESCEEAKYKFAKQAKDEIKERGKGE